MPKGWSVTPWLADVNRLELNAVITAPWGDARRVTVRYEDLRHEDLHKGSPYVEHLKDVLVRNAMRKIARER